MAITLNPAQIKLVQSKARFVGMIGGRGSGKTFGGAVKALMKAADQGEPGIVVAPDFPHFTKSTWPVLRDLIPWGRVRNGDLNHPYTQDKRLVVATNYGDTEIYYGGIEDPTSWAGPSVNWFWFDEGGRKDTRHAFDILVGCIRVGENPQGWVTTTPHGMSHWLHDVFVEEMFDKEIKKLCKRRGIQLVEYFHASTEENAINLDEFYYHSLMGTYTGTYRDQELLGRFVVFEGAVYEEFLGTDTHGSIEGGNVSEDADYISGVPIEYGVDDGFTADHPRVFLLSQEIPPYIHVFDEYVCTYELPEKSIENLKAKPYPLASVAYIDTSAAELAHRLWDEDIDTVRSTHSVEEGIKHVRPFIKDNTGFRRLLIHPRCRFTISELMAYHYPTRQRAPKPGSGQPKPAKVQDNAPDALRYLLWNKSIPEIDEQLEIEQAIAEAEELIEVPRVRRANAPLYTWRTRG